MYIESLSISNLRCFHQAELRFCVPGSREESVSLPNVNLLLGNNGAGKTSVLRAIALVTLGDVLVESGFVPFNLVRREPVLLRHRGKQVSIANQAGAVKSNVLLHDQDLGKSLGSWKSEQEMHANIYRTGGEERLMHAWIPRATGNIDSQELTDLRFDRGSPAFFIVGYGANRRVENIQSFDSSLRAKSRRLRYQRVASLFEEYVTLTPLGSWLPSLKRGARSRFDEVVQLVNKLLPEECRLTDALENGDYLFAYHRIPVPFAALSDGYRAYLGWVTDLLYHLQMGSPKNKKLTDSKGIVLVDEVDLHLHPEWQREVVPRLARTFPNLQFVLTTHSPIVAGTLHAQNIQLIEPGPQGSVVKRLEERIHGLNADQILLSSYFGLKSSRAEDAVNELRNLSRQAQEGDPASVVQFLRKLTDSTFTEEEKAQLGKPAPKSRVRSTPKSARRSTRK